MNNDPLPGWTGQAKQVLDDSAQGLDAATLSRLNRARQKALDEMKPRRFRPWFVPAGVASACAVLLAVAVVWHQPASLPASNGVFTIGTPGAQGNAGFSANDLDIVSSDDGIEFYQDLDFYAWLDSQNPDNNG